MKVLYQIYTPYNRGDIFYWAESEEEALGMAYRQWLAKDVEARAEKVWANNDDIKYMGYVINEK